MDVEMTLIGFVADAPHTRMGMRVPLYNPTNDFARWAILTNASQLCIVEGCGLPTSTTKPHGWTCDAHDPLSAKKRGSV